MRKGAGIIFIVIIILIGVYFILSSNQEDSTTFSKTASEIKEFNGQVKEFNITARSWRFEPDTIEVNQGDKIIINLNSIDVSHGINIPELGVSLKTGSGETKTVEFIAGKKGEFSFSCNVYCGEGHGLMRGKLIVR
ncbi:MAG: cupredoxin domain-containing protein [archaeon]|nr:cupredoxin domain-containing protein [archaeon]MCR4323740.1 cupredoxin domain-containing protein [Nanoarchaeota archaeon]